MSLPAYAASLIYSNNTNIDLTTPGITLVIQAPSVADGLTVNAASVAVTLSAGETFTLTSPQSLSSFTIGSGGSLSQTCVSGTETEAIVQSAGSETYTLTPTGSACVPQHTVGGGGGGGSITYTPSVTIQTPGSGGSYNHGAVLGMVWTPANGAFIKYKIYYSIDNGTTWTTIADSATGTSLSWIIPDSSTVLGKIKVEGYNSSNTLLASALSAGNFTIVGSAPATNNPPPTTNPPPAVDPNIVGSYDAASALANTPDIATDKGLSAPPAGTTVHCAAGTLIKGTLPSVYYCGADGKRYVFVNEKAYFSWYADFSTVIMIFDTDLALITIGGNVTYRPGARMVKIMSDPKVYAVARGGILRWIMTEAAAARLYGANWNKMIDDIPDSFFVNYKMGLPINE